MQHNNLWEVNDNLLQHPENKFYKRSSPLIEATVEQWGVHQLENAPVPMEMQEFVKRFASLLGFAETKTLNVKDVCHYIMTRIEFYEPYYFLVDTLVQLAHGSEFDTTYRHKATGNVLDPSTMEIFKLSRGWDFKPYHTIKNMLEHPGMQAFLKNNVVPNQFRDRGHAMHELMKKMAEVVWGQFGWFSDFTDEALTAFEDCLNEDGYQDWHAESEHYRNFWYACTLGVMTWLKGPGAVPFLTRYHVIYSELLDLNDEGKPVPKPNSRDMVMVSGVEVFTMRELDVFPGRAPDTCVCCNSHVHCTKMLNVTALHHPVCSCGGNVDCLDSRPVHEMHFRQACAPYRMAHPEKFGFVCQRCIFQIVNKLTQQVCGRATCPAVKCPHHQGELARMRALTQNRTRQLTSAQVS